jgi:hypothetical protein
VENWKIGNPDAAQNQRFLILKQSNKNITNIYSGVFDNRIGNWSKKLEKQNNIIKYIGMDGTPSELHHNKSLFSESKPNTCNNKVDIIVIIMIGINTKIHAITENPKSHSIFIINVNTIIIINFRKAAFITPL